MITHMHVYVTVHEKIMHNACAEIFFELRPPLPTTMFELLCTIAPANLKSLARVVMEI